jgi:hypothetical protein
MFLNTNTLCCYKMTNFGVDYLYGFYELDNSVWDSGRWWGKYKLTYLQTNWKLI